MKIKKLQKKRFGVKNLKSFGVVNLLCFTFSTYRSIFGRGRRGIQGQMASFFSRRYCRLSKIPQRTQEPEAAARKFEPGLPP